MSELIVASELLKQAGDALSKSGELSSASEVLKQEQFRLGEVKLPEINPVDFEKSTDLANNLDNAYENKNSPQAVGEESNAEKDELMENKSADKDLDNSNNIDKEKDNVDGDNRCNDASDDESQIVKNKREGCRRENEVCNEKIEKYPTAEYDHCKERTLLDKNGDPVKDPETGETRRVDLVIVDKKTGKAVEACEITSPSAPKEEQMQKEARIRENGGTYIRNNETGQLVDISNVKTEIERRT